MFHEDGLSLLWETSSGGLTQGWIIHFHVKWVMASRLLLGAWLELCMWNCGFSPRASLHRSVGLPYSMIAELQEQIPPPKDGRNHAFLWSSFGNHIECYFHCTALVEIVTEACLSSRTGNIDPISWWGCDKFLEENVSKRYCCGHLRKIRSAIVLHCILSYHNWSYHMRVVNVIWVSVIKYLLSARRVVNSIILLNVT